MVKKYFWLSQVVILFLPESSPVVQERVKLMLLSICCYRSVRRVIRSNKEWNQTKTLSSFPFLSHQRSCPGFGLQEFSPNPTQNAFSFIH